MKNLFKAFIVLAVVLAFSTTESKAQMSAGGGLVFGTGINNIGISVNGKYDFTEQWSAAPAFTYFFKKDGLTWMILDLDANYMIAEFDGVGGLYGIGGLGMTFAHYKIDADLGAWGDYSTSGTTTTVGLNLGAGLNIPLGDNMAIAPELKFTIANGSFFRIGAKFMFGF
jgi:hypothetical protein